MPLHSGAFTYFLNICVRFFCKHHNVAIEIYEYNTLVTQTK